MLTWLSMLFFVLRLALEAVRRESLQLQVLSQAILQKLFYYPLIFTGQMAVRQKRSSKVWPIKR
jgi:hypothetical protein